MTDDRAAHAARPAEPPAPKGRWLVLGLLTLVYSLNIADRFVVATLIEPIKAELHLSDAGVGFLTGVALALFFVTAGLPLATFADRSNRRNLIAAALTAWSVMTAVCGFVQNFWQLALARVGVGVGEAGGVPSSQSILSDYFPWRQRALASNIFTIGGSIGSMIGSAAGLASDAWGWRSAFLLLGVPGILLAPLLLRWVREPQRGQSDESAAAVSRASLLQTARFIRGQPALLHCYAGAGLFALWALGLIWWTPAFLARSHHFSVGAAGSTLSLMHGVGGTTVLLLSSVLMGYLGRLDARAVPWFLAAMMAICSVPTIIAYSTSSASLAIAMLWIFVPLSYSTWGAQFAVVQNLVPGAMRAQAAAILLLVANVANLILAPELVGWASDAMAPRLGPESLRGALIPLSFTGLWCAYHFWASARYFAAGLARAGNPALQKAS